MPNNKSLIDNPGLVKVGFKIEDSALGSTFAETETIWAKKVNENEYEINSIPFDAYGVSWGDIVAVKIDPDGMLMYDKTLKYGGHSTFRFKTLVEDKGSIYTNSLIKRINKLGCGTETSGIIDNFITIDVPPAVDPNIIGDVLAVEAKTGMLDFEEASVPDDYVSKKY